jgi:flavin-dependent dehydrogenase
MMHQTTGANSADVVIVGGGPAGLAAAIALRQKGIECMVVEALEPPIDKCCGEGLMPDALHSLKALGVEIREEEGYPFQGIRFANSTHRVDADFPNGAGIGVRRTHLHQRMSDRACEVGVRLMWGNRVTLLSQQEVVVNGVPTRFRWLIGADGTASQVRRWAGLGAEKAFSQRVSFRRHYETAPWSEYVEVHWGAIGQVYITPVARDRVCVVFITRSGRVDREHFLNGFPEVTRKLVGAPIVPQERGAVSVTRKLNRVANETVALIGDASGSADAITGEGLAQSFRQAVALAASIEDGKLSDYNKAHRLIARLPHAMARLMLTMDRWPAMEKHGMRALASDTSFFEELLAVHMGVESLPSFALRRGPSLGWRILFNHG